jgi:PAS domain S-box-containing protein
MENRDNQLQQGAGLSSNSGLALRRRAEEAVREKTEPAPKNQKAPSSEETRRVLHELRVHQAELEIQNEELRRTHSPENLEALSPKETQRVLHELRVHQAELEIQNEELRRTQVELEVSRERYFDLYDLAPVGYVTLSEKGLFLEANLTASALLGVVRSMLLKQSLTRFILPEDQDIYFLHRKQLFETGKPQAYELRMVKKDGPAFWVRLDTTLGHDMDGTPVYRAVISNITSRKQAEELLQRVNNELEMRVRERTKELAQAVGFLEGENRERMLAEKAAKTERKRLYDVLETLPAYVVLLTEQYHIAFANHTFRELFGKSGSKQSDEYLFHRTEPCEICSTYKKVLRTNAPQHWEWKGPNDRYYDIYDFPFTDSDGSLLIMETGIDITERKEAEQELHRSQKKLRSLAVQLQVVEERQRRQIASDLHDSVGQMLSFAVRELLSLQKNVSGKTAQSIREISDQLHEVVKQVRTLSFDLSPGILYDLGFEVAVEDMVERFAKERKIQWEFENSGESKPLTDNVKVLLYRSVRELLINTAKHAGAVCVTVSLTRSDNNISIVVEDNGKGFNVSDLRGQMGKPCGFGLFNIREQLSHIGGRFEIESAENKGTKITLTAPLNV